MGAVPALDELVEVAGGRYELGEPGEARPGPFSTSSEGMSVHLSTTLFDQDSARLVVVSCCTVRGGQLLVGLGRIFACAVVQQL